MSDQAYLENARVILGMVHRAFPGWTPEQRASLLSVALGLHVGEVAFPKDPRQMLVHTGVILGTAAMFAQREMTREAKQSCEGRA
jgi:hypothetical protein